MTDDREVVREALLVLRAQSGDRTAVDELFARVEVALGRHVRHVVRNDAVAEDALQEAFLLGYRKMRWLRDPLLFRPWLYRIATREAVRFAGRERARRERSLDQCDDHAVGSRGEPARLEEMMVNEAAAAIEQVSPASRAVLSLHYLEGYTLQESADILGVSAGTIKSRLSAGLTQLRRLLAVGTRDRGDE